MTTKEFRIVISSVKGFNDKARLQHAVNSLLGDIFAMNEEVASDDDELIDDSKILVMINGERNTAAVMLEDIIPTTIDIEIIKVDWSKGKKAFYDNCSVLGGRATHAIVFWDDKDEGQRNLIKSCLENGARVRLYPSAV